MVVKKRRENETLGTTTRLTVAKAI